MNIKSYLISHLKKIQGEGLIISKYKLLFRDYDKVKELEDYFKSNNVKIPLYYFLLYRFLEKGEKDL